jgi:hypothetical protein
MQTAKNVSMNFAPRQSDVASQQILAAMCLSDSNEQFFIVVLKNLIIKEIVA